MAPISIVWSTHCQNMVNSRFYSKNRCHAPNLFREMGTAPISAEHPMSVGISIYIYVLKSDFGTDIYIYIYICSKPGYGESDLSKMAFGRVRLANCRVRLDLLIGPYQLLSYPSNVKTCPFMFIIYFLFFSFLRLKNF